MPKVNVTASQVPLHEQVDQSIAALVAANDEREPRVVVHVGALMRMEHGQLKPWKRASMRDELSRSADYVRMVKDGDGDDWVEKRCLPPVEVVDAVLERDNYPGLPCVDTVVTAPVAISPGVIITQAGVEPGSRIWLKPDEGLEGMAIPEHVNADEVKAARSLLVDDLLGEFCWLDDSSKANALGMLFVPFVRDLIKGQVPLHAILARDIGTGKTLLATTALHPACGEIALTPDKRDEEEWRKAITASLIGGAPAIVFDNIKESLGNAALAAVTTAPVWRDRILGHSTETNIKVSTLFVATGNQTNFTREMSRRTVAIQLEATGDVRPSDMPPGTFQHDDLLGWTRSHRAELVHAALVLVRNWLDGQVLDGPFLHPAPADTAGWRVEGQRNLGSFEAWARVIGGILEAADVHGFMENDEAFQADSNIEQQELINFYATWHELGLEPMTIPELAKLCGPMGAAPALREALPEGLAEVSSYEDRLSKAMRYYLRAHKKVRAGGYQLIDDDPGHHHSARWSVRKTVGGT